MRAYLILLSLLLLINGGSFKALAEEYTDEELGVRARPHKPLTSIEAWSELPKGNASSQLMSAEYSTRHNYIEQAIKQSKKALDRDYNDIDAHMAYAEALENKIKTQDERDPYLFNECVKEWLMVLRNEVGDESGMTFRGIGLPVIQKLYEDSARHGNARKHLVDLTGTLPKGWETNTRFLKRVAKDADAKVAGKIIKRTEAKTH